jgi:hypothetical protein
VRIILDMGGEAATLAEPDDFQAFAAVASGPADADRLAVAARTVGRPVAASHVLVDVAALRAMEGARPADAAWAEGLDGMLAFAASKGWTDEGGAVRAHVEWRASAGG